MIKLNILIVNPDEKQGSEWRSRLEKSDHNVVAVQPGLSGMVFTMSREKIHIALCASSLIKDKAYTVLNNAIKFFPRVKIVVIGTIPLPYALPKLTNVVIKQKFDCNLRELFSFPDNAPAYGGNDDALRLLLGEHFLEYGECNAILKNIGPHWVPEFAVIGIITDSNADFIMRVLDGLKKELSYCAAVKMDSLEICVVLDKNPDMERCLAAADTIRRHLLQRTDSGFSIGVSRSRSRADELFACRKEALRAAQASHFYGRDSVIHISFLDDNDVWYVYPYHKERRMVERALDGDSAGALKLLDELFLFFENRKDLRKNYVHKIAMRIWVQMNLAASSRLKSYETAQMDSMSYGKLLLLKAQKDIYEFLKDGILSLAGEMYEMSDVKRDVLFVRLCGLKDRDAGMTPSELTKEFHTTVGFLNDAIVRNSQESIFDFFPEGQDPDPAGTAKRDKEPDAKE